MVMSCPIRSGFLEGMPHMVATRSLGFFQSPAHVAPSVCAVVRGVVIQTLHLTRLENPLTQDPKHWTGIGPSYRTNLSSQDGEWSKHKALSG